MNQRTRQVMFSSKRQDWSTPKGTFDMLDYEFGFTLDPCCTKETAKCSTFFTKEEDGLKQSWQGHIVFCNPPFGKDMSKWIKKGYDEWKQGNCTVVFLIPVRTDTAYFHDYLYGRAKLRFFRGRLKFGGSDNSAPFPSMVAILMKENDKTN